MIAPLAKFIDWSTLQINLTRIHPVIPSENILLMEGIYDFLCPKDDIEDLWQTWGQPWRLPRLHFRANWHSRTQPTGAAPPVGTEASRRGFAAPAVRAEPPQNLHTPRTTDPRSWRTIFPEVKKEGCT